MKGRPLRQERFASAAERSKGILGNLTALRAQCLPSARDRELIWWLQEQSLRRIGAPHFTCSSFEASAAGSMIAGATAFEQLAHSLGERFPERIVGRASRLIRELPPFFTRLCLDPSTSPESAEVKCFKSIMPALREFKMERERAHLDKVADTAVARAVFETLEFGASQNGIVIAEGEYRSGKSFAAQAWCLQRPGRARYLSLNAFNDETTFFKTVATALGTAASAQRKAVEMRLRVEDALRGRDLMLVIDEAEHLLPSSARPSSAPERLRWLMTMQNAGVKIALIAGSNFSRMLANYERRVPTFSFSQWHGRVSLHKRLPNTLSEADLFAVARCLAPEADENTRTLLTATTMLAKGRIAAMEHVVGRARFLASSEGQRLTFDFVEAALAESPPSRFAVSSERTMELQSAVVIGSANDSRRARTR